jgi:hypothetical protein
MVWFPFLHYTSLCISCDKNLEEFLMLCFVLWASCCSFLSIKIYVYTWVDLLFVNKDHKQTMMESCIVGTKSLFNQVLLPWWPHAWFPKTRKEHTGKFKQCWFGPYMIQYCLPNNITFLVTVNKFDPNPILININKLKPHWFQDKSASRRLESIVERGRDRTNIEIRFNITTLENA